MRVFIHYPGLFCFTCLSGALLLLPISTAAALQQPKDKAKLSPPAVLLDLETRKLFEGRPTLSGLVTFSPDSRRVAYHWEQAFHVFDFAQKKEISVISTKKRDYAPKAVIFSQAGDKLAIRDNTNHEIWVVGVGSDRVVEMYRVHGNERKDTEPFTFTPDGQFIVAILAHSPDDKAALPRTGGIQVCSAESGKQIRWFGSKEHGDIVAFYLNHDGKQVLAEHRLLLTKNTFDRDKTYSERITLHRWELETGKWLGSFGDAVEAKFWQAMGQKVFRDRWKFGAILNQAGASDHGCRVRVSPFGTVHIVTRKSPEAALDVIICKDNPKALCLRESLSEREIQRIWGFEDGSPTPRSLSADTTKLAFLQSKPGSIFVKLRVLDLSPARAAAIASRAEPNQEELEKLWEDLGGPDIKEVQRASRQMMAHPTATLRFLNRRLQPVPDSSKTIANLLGQLEDGDTKARQKAEKELVRLGELAIGPVKRSLMQKPTDRAQAHLQAVVDAFKPESAPDAATCRLLETVDLLERLANPAAEKLLMRLAGGMPDAWATREAAAALEISRRAMGR